MLTRKNHFVILSYSGYTGYEKIDNGMYSMHTNIMILNTSQIGSNL